MAAILRPATRSPAARAPAGPALPRGFMLASMAGISYPGTEAEQLLLAPQICARPIRALPPRSITAISASPAAWRIGQSPFDHAAVGGWARELYGFGWLRHLRAAGSELSREQAKALRQRLRALMQSRARACLAARDRRAPGHLLAVELRARAGYAIPRAYETFLQPLTAHLRYLSASYRDAPDGAAAAAHAHGAYLCRPLHRRAAGGVERYLMPFSKELDRQILPDGGHISRNPTTLIELLLEFLPLKQCFLVRSRETPEC